MLNFKWNLPWLILNYITSYISKTLSKGLNWTNPQHISGATVIVDFEVENDKKISVSLCIKVVSLCLSFPKR
jgi:hypothetical protein